MKEISVKDVKFGDILIFDAFLNDPNYAIDVYQVTGTSLGRIWYSFIGRSVVDRWCDDYFGYDGHMLMAHAKVNYTAYRLSSAPVRKRKCRCNSFTKEYFGCKCKAKEVQYG